MDSVVSALLQRYRERAAAGSVKYGTTMDREDLRPLDWVVHAQEEAMDLSVYLERLRRELEAEPQVAVRAFHEKYGLPVDQGLRWYNSRLRLIDEELGELKSALLEEDLTNVLKEWADLLFVLWGMAVEFGFDHLGAEVFRGVAESNMTKDGGVDGNGKLTKGPGYREPDMRGLW